MSISIKQQQQQQDSLPTQLLASKINNQAAYCIETGHFEGAISLLVKALKLSEQIADSHVCRCAQCTLDGALSMGRNSTTRKKSRSNDEQGCSTSSSRPTKRRRMSQSPQTSPTQEQQPKQSNESNKDCKASRESTVPQTPTPTTSTPKQEGEEGGYVYRKPIYVSKSCVQSGHSLGVTLSLIVLFNLALAHHLSALKQEEKSNIKRRLQKALQLYELAYQLQMEEQQRVVTSIRFTMIVSNNLSEIHRVAHNHSKRILCLQHLLSTMMYVVDCQLPNGNVLDLDGFFQNTSQLIFQTKCASAA